MLGRMTAPMSVAEFVETLFEDDLHTKRVLALAEVTSGAVSAGAVGIHVIGRALALAKGRERKSEKKHSVKQVDRLVGNEAIDVWALFSKWVPYVVSNRPEVWVALDWTEFDADGHSTLVVSQVSSHGRTTPLLWRTFEKKAIKGSRLDAEKLVLARLREVLPATATRVLILADRGFSDPARWQAIQSLGFDFITRIRGDLHVTNAKGHMKSAAEWLAPSGKATLLKDVSVTQAQLPARSFVSAKMPKMKEGWYLVSSLSDVAGAELVQRYSRRFTIEESFRDLKDLRFGMGLSSTRVSTSGRRDRLLLVSALAIAFLTILGAAGEAIGIDKYFKTNTSTKRQYSLFRQGCDYFDFLPGMTEERARLLIEKFSELLTAHEIGSLVLGFI
jgi:hypothetical protein